MKTWTCQFCGQAEDSEWVAPTGWLTLRDPGEILVCSMGCASSVVTAIKEKEAREWSST